MSRLRSRRLRLPLAPAWLRWLIVASMLVAILVASVVRPSGLQGVAGPLGITPSTWLHGVAYAGLAVALVYALHTSPRPNWQVLAGVFVLATGFGLGIEILQLGIPYRAYDPADVAVNAAGAALAVTGWNLLVRRVQFYRLRRLEEMFERHDEPGD